MDLITLLQREKQQMVIKFDRAIAALQGEVPKKEASSETNHRLHWSQTPVGRAKLRRQAKAYWRNKRAA